MFLPPNLYGEVLKMYKDEMITISMFLLFAIVFVIGGVDYYYGERVKEIGSYVSSEHYYDDEENTYHYYVTIRLEDNSELKVETSKLIWDELKKGTDIDLRSVYGRWSHIWRGSEIVSYYPHRVRNIMGESFKK
jgi:hypothetical protein